VSALHLKTPQNVEFLHGPKYLVTQWLPISEITLENKRCIAGTGETSLETTLLPCVVDEMGCLDHAIHCCSPCETRETIVFGAQIAICTGRAVKLFVPVYMAKGHKIVRDA